VDVGLGPFSNHDGEEILTNIFLNQGPTAPQVNIALGARRAQIDAIDADPEGTLCGSLDERGAEALGFSPMS
jgi:hypothetical protein